MRLPLFAVDDVIKRALNEDISYLDTTTDYLIEEDAMGDAYLLAKAQGVLCGLEIAMRVFSLIDPAFTFQAQKQDGDRVEKGERIASLHGHTRALLKGERTALNLLQHLSGIATATAQAVELVAGTGATIVG